MSFKNQLTIGSDPEFVIINKEGKCVGADKVLLHCDDCDPCSVCEEKRCNGSPDECGACGKCDVSNCGICDVCYSCTKCNMENIGNCVYCLTCKDEKNINIHSEIGFDAYSTIGELRPKYANTPNEHHSNIKELINLIDIPNKYEIRAGTHVGGHSIGGHIHFGNYVRDFVGLKNQFKFPNYMSHFAGMPLRMIEHSEDLEKRGFNEFGYGMFGSHNIQSYGIEWRMPASWLVSSDIALSALSLAHVVGSEFIINPKTIFTPTIEEQKKLLSSANIALEMIKQIEHMMEYKKYSKELEPIFQMLIEGMKWKTNCDIRNNW